MKKACWREPLCTLPHMHEGECNDAANRASMKERSVAVVKNRSTPEGNAFWNHVESVAAQVRKERSAMDSKQEIPEDLKRLYERAHDLSMGFSGRDDVKRLIERIASLEAALKNRESQIEIAIDAGQAVSAQLTFSP